MESNTDSDDSITLRSYPLERDKHCKTIVKIKLDYMDKLGINEGDTQNHGKMCCNDILFLS